MPKVVCRHLRVGREYLESVSWPTALRKEDHDRCYCKRCYPPSLSDTLTVAGYTYVIPRGWTRFAVSIDEAYATHHRVWDEWLNCYHGTSIDNAKSAVEHRQLLLPADVTLEGKKLAIREGHIPGEHFVFTTPSISYAALECYAHTYPFISMHDAKPYLIKVALQCKQKPSSIIVQPETVGARAKQIRICKHIPNEQLEWKTQHRSAVMIYGLMLEVKCLIDDDDSEDQPSISNEGIMMSAPPPFLKPPPTPTPKPPPTPTPFKSKVAAASSSTVESGEAKDVQEPRQMVKRTIAILVALVLLAIIPLTALIIGGANSADCPVQPWVPRWLIVFGAVGLVIFTLLFLLILLTFIFRSDKSLVAQYITGGVVSLLVCFYFAWMIAGSVWVFPYKATVQFTQPSAANYCRETPYMFAFGFLLTQYVLIGLASCIGCIGAICFVITD